MLISQPDERWSRCFIKSVALLPAVMAKYAALEQGGFEALLVRDGAVTEGGSTNMFCVRGGTLFTHPCGPFILSGITRQVVLEAAVREGVPVREEAVTIAEFAGAEEAFMSSTTLNILPATRLDHAPIGDGRVGPVTRRLAQAVEEILAAEIARDMAS
jgi:D-alanine transaminase